MIYRVIISVVLVGLMYLGVKEKPVELYPEKDPYALKGKVSVGYCFSLGNNSYKVMKMEDDTLYILNSGNKPDLEENYLIARIDQLPAEELYDEITCPLPFPE